MNRLFSRFIALFLAFSLVQDPCMAAMGFVGADLVSARKFGSGQAQGLPLQLNLFMRQAVVEPADDFPKGTLANIRAASHVFTAAADQLRAAEGTAKADDAERTAQQASGTGLMGGWGKIALLKMKSVFHPAAPHAKRRLPITGVPGMGKTTMGNYLRDHHGFVHIDMETPENIAKSGNDLLKFIRVLAAKTESVVVTWGFHPLEQAWEVRWFLDHGFEWIWFDGDREAAKREFNRRGTVPEAHFDLQIWRIDFSRIVVWFTARIINTFNSNHEFKSLDDIAAELLGPPQNISQTIQQSPGGGAAGMMHGSAAGRLYDIGDWLERRGLAGAGEWLKRQAALWVAPRTEKSSWASVADDIQEALALLWDPSRDLAENVAAIVEALTDIVEEGAEAFVLKHGTKVLVNGYWVDINQSVRPDDPTSPTHADELRQMYHDVAKDMIAAAVRLAEHTADPWGTGWEKIAQGIWDACISAHAVYNAEHYGKNDGHALAMSKKGQTLSTAERRANIEELERILENFGRGEATYDRFLRYASAIGIVNGDADDVVIDTWLRAYRNRRSFRGDSKPITYFFKVFKSAVFNYHRARKRRPGDSLFIEDLTGMPEPSQNPVKALNFSLLLSSVRQEIGKLDPIFRKAILLWLDEQSYSEIAAALGIKPVLAKSRVARAIQKIVDAMSPLKIILPPLILLGSSVLHDHHASFVHSHKSLPCISA